MKVIRPFVDLQDDNYSYLVGDVYPREGYNPEKKRIDSLASTNNSAGYAFLEKEGRFVESKPLEKLTVKELTELVHEKGLEVPEKVKKNDLLKLLGYDGQSE